MNGTEKSFSYGKFYTPNSEDNWHYDSIVVNNYRYLGSFDSSNINGNHKFNVLIALHVVNSEATIWAQGRYSEEEEEQYYEMGIREKNWKKYDEEGNLVMTITYRNDTEQRINGIRVRLPDSDITLIR